MILIYYNITKQPVLSEKFCLVSPLNYKITIAAYRRKVKITNEQNFTYEGYIMANLLLEEVKYKIEKTHFGIWRRYMYINGTSFHEFKTRSTMFGIPLIHYTYGRSPETGRRVCAKGVIAVGRFACGFIAIGHAALGLLAIGQLALGILLGLGQLSSGIAALGQLAIGAYLGIGQFVTGYIAIGQFAIGKYVLAQLGIGEFVWSTRQTDPHAVAFFKTLPIIRLFIP